MSKWTLILIATGGLIIAATMSSSRLRETHPQASTVKPVEGPGWLKRLGIVMPETRLGQMGGDETIPAAARHEPEIWRDEPAQALNEQFALTGADLYRINCRSCHGPDGQGAPPEIHSLIGPVQGASSVLVQSRMEARGAPISKEMATQMATEAEKAIRDRLSNGGQKMPAFRDLQPTEVTALLSYLDQLAKVPGRQHVAVVSESAARVGEQVVKGTCHTCHDATGPGGGGMMMMMRGIIPSLASLPYDYSLDSVMRQVRYGSSGMMMMGGDRMPPLPYFTQPEIAAAYLYLQAYPPQR